VTGPARRVLVLGSDTHAFLSVIRSLGRAGIQVHVAWHQPDSPALRSRYVHRAHNLPPYFGPVDAWLPALRDLMQQEAFDLVLPCHDQMVIPLQRHRAELEPFGRICLISDEAFDVLFDKFKTTQLARSLGISVPREMLVTQPDQNAEVRALFDLPVVIKQRSSFDFADLTTVRSVHKAYDWRNVDQSLAGVTSCAPVIVQENVLGTGVGVELLMKNGEVLLAFQHERVHEPPHGGGSSYRKSVPLSPELLDAAVRLLRALNYTGVAMAEFKVDRGTGRWVLLEVNARFWGSLPLAVAAGANFPLALFHLLVDGRTQVPRTYAVGLYCRSLSWDVWWHIENLRADRSDRTLATRPLARDMTETLRNLLTLHERSDTLTLDDPAPGFAEVAEISTEIWGKLSRRSLKRLLQLPPVRARLQRNARRALRRAQTVLFICHGNICRSPFAEQLARRYFPDKRICSAGYFPESRRTPPETAKRAAARWNVSLADHRSRVLTPALAHKADAVLVFDYPNHQVLTREYGLSRERIHFVGALNSCGPLFIDDPVGRDSTYFERVYNQIATALESANQVDR
jgi:protein-tyrosine-phosphatase/predicted ATP-grasp superfamily ATP-dependent carboligase